MWETLLEVRGQGGESPALAFVWGNARVCPTSSRNSNTVLPGKGSPLERCKTARPEVIQTYL